jgi:hypothetical protein
MCVIHCNTLILFITRLLNFLVESFIYAYTVHRTFRSRLRLKRDGTRAETRVSFSPKRTSPFKSAGASVQPTAGSRVVRMNVSNAGYTTFRGSVRVLATHSIRQFLFTSPPVHHRVPSGFKRTLPFLCI